LKIFLKKIYFMQIKPFQALRPRQSIAEKVSSVPYDVVSTEEARSLGQNNPLSVLHVIRPEIDFSAVTDPYSDVIYARAVQNFKRLQEEGNFVRESEPSFYLYEQQKDQHRQQGLVGVCHVQDYESGMIKRHEKTRFEKERDRTRLTSELNANLGPVFLTYRDDLTLDLVLKQAVTKSHRIFNFKTEDNISHTLWRISANEDIIRALREIPCAYIADGHHRAASATRVARERREANPSHTGKEDYNWFLCILFPATQLNILPYNRLIADLNGLSKKRFLEMVGKVATLTQGANSTPVQAGNISMYFDGQWYNVHSPIKLNSDPVSCLDVSLLQERILSPILSIDNSRTSTRIDFIDGARGTNFLSNEVDSGRSAVAFSMYPVDIKSLMAVADANEMMPPKSTWFEPKPRSGLLIYTF
jgi:uncharacterized protein (DUF1015 family)